MRFVSCLLYFSFLFCLAHTFFSSVFSVFFFFCICLYFAMLDPNYTHLPMLNFEWNKLSIHRHVEYTIGTLLKYQQLTRTVESYISSCILAYHFILLYYTIKHSFRTHFKIVLQVMMIMDTTRLKMNVN